MITVITGPPCSGKSTYAREHAQAGDVIIDFDVIAQAFGSPGTHDHPGHIVSITGAAWYAAVKWAVANSRRVRIWLVDTEPPAYRRTAYARAGAQYVDLTASEDEITQRAKAREQG